MRKKILIGKIISVFGIKGEVKIASYCQDYKNIEKYEIFDQNEVQFKIKISNKNKRIIGTTKDGGEILIAKIAGIDNRNDAEKLRGRELYVNRENFKELKNNDEFYQTDLIGLDVIDENEVKIGKVINVMDFGAGAMIEIEFTQENKAKNLQKIENFPFKNEFFPEVNIAQKIIKITL